MISLEFVVPKIDTKKHNNDDNHSNVIINSNRVMNSVVITGYIQ